MRYSGQPHLLAAWGVLPVDASRVKSKSLCGSHGDSLQPADTSEFLTRHQITVVFGLDHAVCFKALLQRCHGAKYVIVRSY